MILRSIYLFPSFFSFGLAFLTPRNSSDPLTTTLIPVILDSHGRYTVDVSMSSPTQPQNFKFLLTTSTGYSIVAGASCPSCNDVPAYNHSLSSSASPVSLDDATVRVGQGAASGIFYYEDCRLPAADPPWSYPHQSVLVANQSSSLFKDGISGVMGLGTNGGAQSDFNSTLYSNWLGRNPTHANFTYGMALNQPTANSTDGGVIHWVKPDQSFIQGDTAWKAMQPLNDTTGYDFNVLMDRWNFSTESTSLSRTSQFPTILDPFVSSTVMPKAEAELLYVNIPGSASASNDSVTTEWTVPCSSKFGVSFVFDNVSITMDESVLVGIRQDNGDCLAGIAGWVLDSDDQYLLGANFLSSAYIVFEIAGSADGLIGFSNREKAQPQKTPAAAIVGAVLGSLAFAIALGVCCFLVYRHRKDKRKLLTPHPRDQYGVRPYRPDERFSLTTSESVGLLAPRPASVNSPITPYRYTPVSTLASSQTVLVPARSDRATTDGDSPPPYVITSPVLGEFGTLQANRYLEPPASQSQVIPQQAHRPASRSQTYHHSRTPSRSSPNHSQSRRSSQSPVHTQSRRNSDGTTRNVSARHSESQFVRLSHGGETILVGPPPADRKGTRRAR